MRLRTALLTTGLMLAVGQVLADTQHDARTQLEAMRLEVSAERLVQYAAQGDASVVQLLLQAGIKATDADPVRHVTALHNAAAQGHVGLVKLLMERGADVNAADWQGITPLIAASFYGRVEAMRMLLAQGAAADVRPAGGPTALVAATYSGNVKAVDLLLQSGANPAQADAFGNTAQTVALATKRTEITARLQHGADTSASR